MGIYIAQHLNLMRPVCSFLALVDTSLGEGDLFEASAALPLLVDFQVEAVAGRLWEEVVGIQPLPPVSLSSMVAVVGFPLHVTSLGVDNAVLGSFLKQIFK